MIVRSDPLQALWNHEERKGSLHLLTSGQIFIAQASQGPRFIAIIDVRKWTVLKTKVPFFLFTQPAMAMMKRSFGGEWSVAGSIIAATTYQMCDNRVLLLREDCLWERYDSGSWLYKLIHSMHSRVVSAATWDWAQNMEQRGTDDGWRAMQQPSRRRKEGARSTETHEKNGKPYILLCKDVITIFWSEDCIYGYSCTLMQHPCTSLEIKDDKNGPFLLSKHINSTT